MKTANDLMNDAIFSCGKSFKIKSNINYINEIKEIETERNKDLISKMVGYLSNNYSELSALQCSYFSVKGYLDCANKLFWITDEEYKNINHILLSFYISTMVKFESNQINGIEALKRLIDRNINESGSGAIAVKGVLLSLYNGSKYPFNLTSLRNLDHNNFDDVMSVLNMNARSCPAKEIHKYLENGYEIWEKMERELCKSYA